MIATVHSFEILETFLAKIMIKNKFFIFVLEVS